MGDEVISTPCLLGRFSFCNSGRSRMVRNAEEEDLFVMIPIFNLVQDLNGDGTQKWPFEMLIELSPH